MSIRTGPGYYAKVGYDPGHAEALRASEWLLGLYRYWKPFQADQHFVRHPSNSGLATHTVYTEGKTPEDVRDEVVALVLGD